MKLFLLDRDGVLVVNRPTNVKSPADIRLIDGAAEAIARLNAHGYAVALCTNQPEIGRGVLSAADVRRVHDGLLAMLAERGARIDKVLCSGSTCRTPRTKPAGGMLREAVAAFGADAADTWFVGDQKDDLQAALHAGCRGVLVRTGLGRKLVAAGLPLYLARTPVYRDLAAAVDARLCSGPCLPAPLPS